ncbi:MAG: hypothetical protein KC472_03815 [Dehalococcoidia bacterium]|nr:hypothetical protein [Dehalococcoidia bacterium]
MTTPASAVSHDRPSDSASRAERLVAAEDAFTRGDFVAAEASTQAMLADDPTDGRALLIAGAIALARHAHRDALDLTDRAIAAWRDGDPPASLQHNRGIALGGMGRLDEAVEALAAAVSIVPNHRQYRASLAMLLHAAGRREESFEVAAAASGAPENVIAAAVAFEVGNLGLCRQLLDRSLPGFERGVREQLAEKQWHELRTYHRYLDALLAYRRRNSEPPSKSREPLYVVGDSHSLSPARFPLRLAGRPYVATPRLVFGVKAWHLARAQRGDANLYAAAFARALGSLPSGATAAMSVGEIDTRAEEGFLPVLRRAGIDTIEGRRERIAPAMADALAFAARAAREAGVTLAAITVPAPRADVSDRSAEDGRDVAEVIQLVNDSMREAATELGLGVIDIYEHTVGADRFARPGLHLDSVHLLPSVLGKASR